MDSTRQFFNILGSLGFRVEVEDLSDFHVNFIVYEITGGNFEDLGTYDENDLDLYCKAYIKGDSACQFWFGEKDNNTGKQDGYLRFYDSDDFRKHFKLLEFLYNKAFELMGKPTWEGLEWNVKID